MSTIKLYGILGSPFVRAVQVGLKEKGLEFEVHALAPGQHKEPEHLERHPFGRVPAFEHDGFSIYETQAILRYLDDVFPNPPLTPGNPRQRTAMNQIIGIIECYFFPKAAAPIAFNRIIGPRLLGLPANEAAIADAMPMAKVCFTELDRLLGDKPYLAGESLSIADIMLAAQLDLLCATPEGSELIAGTRLKPWLERMISRPSFAETEPTMLKEAA